jgi:hypothetical protein
MELDAESAKIWKTYGDLRAITESIEMSENELYLLKYGAMALRWLLQKRGYRIYVEEPDMKQEQIGRAIAASPSTTTMPVQPSTL